MHIKQPVDFFFIFVDEGVLYIMVQETNKYALQKLIATISPKAIIRKWKYINTNEMKIFTGVQM